MPIRAALGVLILLGSGCSLETSLLPPEDATSDDGATRDASTPMRDGGGVDTGAGDSQLPGDSSMGADSSSPLDGGVDAAPDTGPSCVPATEECNGRDDDCDGVIDEEGCPCDRLEYAGSIYLFCVSGSSFDDASAVCANFGYHLVFIDSEPEQSFLWPEAEARFDNDWWIGLTDRDTEGRCLWLDGTVAWEGGAATGYHAFRGGSPEASESEDCFEMDGPTDGQWASGTCDQVQPYVCELP